MSYLHELKPHPKAKHRRKRVGRGPGSGTGKTSGRGHKGQKARGPGPRLGFEGGQMPLARTLPKRGFSARSKVKFQVINVGALERVQGEGPIDNLVLRKAGLIKSMRVPVKILGSGEVKRALQIQVDAASRQALEKIKKAGGACTLRANNTVKA